MSTENEPIAGETKDAKGVPFDSARHLPRPNSKTGCWMPKSPGRGRKPDAVVSPASIPTPPPSSAPITDAPPSPPPSASVETVTPDVTPPPPLRRRLTTSKAAADRAPTPDPEPGADAGNDAPPNKGAGDAKSSPDDLARVVQKGLYLATGKALGNMKAAVPPADQDKALHDMLSAFLRWRSIQVVGWLALGVGLISYFLRDEIFDAINAMRKGKPEPRPVTPIAAPVTRPVANQPTQPTGGSAFDSPPFDPLGGHL